MIFVKWIRKKIHKVEFSKLLCGLIALIIGAVAIYAIARYYALMQLAIEYNSTAAPDATLAVTCVSVLLGAFLSYCLYQFGLKNSRNKYGVNTDGIPYQEQIKSLYEEIKNNSNNDNNNEGVG
jgi:uncharacterized protein YacL